MNPLDYWYWSHVNKLVKDKCLEQGRKPEAIEEIRELVEEASDTLTEDVIRRAVQNIRKRAAKCLESDKPGPGGHFQHMMQR